MASWARCWMRPSLAAWLAGVAVMACGPGMDEPELAIEARCGEAAPHRLLPLAPEELVLGPVARHGDHWLVAVTSFPDEIVDVSRPPSLFEPGLPPPTGARVVSIGACGEDPRVVAEDISYVLAPRDSGGAWLGCDMLAQAYAFDPNGAWAPRPLGTCDSMTRSERSIVHEADGALVRRDLEADRVTTEVLVPDLVEWVNPWQGELGGDVFAIDVHGDLLAIDPSSGQLELLRSDATWIESLYDDDRFVVWGNGEPYEDPLLLDRERGVDVPLASGDGWDLLSTTHAVAAYDVSTSRDETRVVMLSDRSERLLDGAWYLSASWDDGLLLVPSVFHPLHDEDTHHLYVLRAADEHPMVLVEDASFHALEDGVLWFTRTQPAADDGEPVYDLFRMRLDGGSAELVVRGLVTPSAYLGHDRFAIVTGAGEDDHGELSIVDGSSASPLAIADDVEDNFCYLEPRRDRFAPVDPLVFAVRDRDHERTGLWQVAVEPPR